MKNLIVGNWKTNPVSLVEAKHLFNLIKRGVKNLKKTEVVICPPFLFLSELKKNQKPIKLGAQNCFWAEKGAFTGEISPLMLKNLGCDYVILGHSERRALGETDMMINKKITACLKAKLIPILCLGETEEQRKTGKTFEILKKQLTAAFKNLKLKIENSPLCVAYEPVWAIGTGKACDIREARRINNFLNNLTHHLPLLYGGSVNAQNGIAYLTQAGFQGLLVGGLSLKVNDFVKLIKQVDFL
ncbi:MAG: triose-phosphate isomerase [Minisyncoccales bacterium]